MNTLKHIINNFDVGENEIRNINRTEMAQTLGELGFKTGAEIGVAEGLHAKVLCDNIPGLELALIDIWEEYPGYTEYKNTNEVYLEARERLKPYNANFIKKFSMDAISLFDDNSLDFVYIDSAHDFKNVAMDISEWSGKVKPGGIVFGHDYKYHQAYIDKGRQRHPIEVKPVVDAYCYCKGIELYVLDNDKQDPTFNWDNPGWMFVRSEKDPL